MKNRQKYRINIFILKIGFIDTITNWAFDVRSDSHTYSQSSRHNTSPRIAERQNNPGNTSYTLQKSTSTKLNRPSRYSLNRALRKHSPSPACPPLVFRQPPPLVHFGRLEWIPLPSRAISRRTFIEKTNMKKKLKEEKTAFGRRWQFPVYQLISDCQTTHANYANTLALWSPIPLQLFTTKYF